MKTLESLWLWRSALLVLASAALCACAGTLKGSNLTPPLAQAADPTVTGSRGTLSPSAGHALLVRRWKNSYADAKALAAVEQVATGRPLIAGNKVTLLHDGPKTMAAMETAIAAAKDHINLETYIFDQDAVGIRFADLLMQRQRAGIQVNVIYDAVGTIGTPQAFFDRMRDAGIVLLAFNPINPLKSLGPWEPNNRNHRKVLIVDGRVAFTGGINISNTYANSSLFRSKSRSTAKPGWRDTHIRIEGPAVAALQWEFLSTWAKEAASSPSDRNYFPALPNVGDKLVRILASSPDSDQDIYDAYRLAIDGAKKTVHMTNAYFVPDAGILRALIGAARRGVEVKLILPGVLESGLVFHAGNSYYTEMLAGGIKIHQLQTAVLHAKTAVIDGLWSTVGSTNIDTRSFLHNHELNAIVFDREFGDAMESAFEEDLRHSKEVSADEWEQRPVADKLKEWAARKFEYWL